MTDEAELMIAVFTDELTETKRRYKELAAAVWASCLELQALVRSAEKPLVVPSKPVLEVANRLQALVAAHKPGSGV
jgi:hypothetical protein